MVYRVEHICVTFHYMQGFFYTEELLVPYPTLKLEDHSLWAVCDCFSIFTAALHIWWPCPSVIRGCHTMETKDNLTIVLVACSNEHGDELVGSIKGMEFTE
jgi:hypothetical protein